MLRTVHFSLSPKTGIRQVGGHRNSNGSLNSMNSCDFADSRVPEFVRLLCA